MLTVALSCIALLVASTLIHYEGLRLLHAWLGRLSIPNRSRLVVAALGAFVVHGVEIMLWASVVYALVTLADVGSLHSPLGLHWITCLYFSAENYSSLGFGDIAPNGPIRLMAGAEALTGLVLVGWSASFLYLSMESYWSSGGTPRNGPRRGS